MSQVTRKIGLNKGKNRIWLEGKSLTFFGIVHGMRFDVVNSPNSLMIMVNPAGKRKVAGKPDRPIIDMTAATIDNSEFVSRVVSLEKGRVLPGNTGPVLILTGLTQ